MKKNRKQTALAKCVLATIMAMGMMGYTTVWADTPTPSPVDKTVSKDAAGQIYDASHNYHQGYFWTDLGHAQVQIGSGEQIELFTPFIYHTHSEVWNPKDRRYDPVHTGDNSEMKCKESMSRITVGEFDRIIKSLYTNDITMAKTIYGEAGQAGLKDTVIKAVRATPGQGKTVNTYELVRANDEVVAAAIVDTDTKITGNELTFADGTLTSKITDNAGGVYTDSVDGIASQGWVNEQMQGIVDTNTTNTGMEGSLDEYGKLTVKVKDSDQRSVQAEVEGIASRSWVNNQLEGIAGTDTVTTVESKTNMLKITDEGTDGNHAYKVDINGDQLGDFVQQYDTNTITTAQADGKGYVNVTEMVDDNGNYNYTVGINEDKLINTIKDNDTNTITTAESVHDIITVNNSMEGQEDGKNYQIGINEDALKGYIKETAQDTDTVTTVESKTNMLKITDEGTDGNHAYKVDINGDQLGDFVQQYDTNTITTAQADGKGYVNVTEMVDDNGNYNYTVGINEDKLMQTIQENDTNTITTAQADGKGYVNVTEMVDDNGNYNYTVGINEDKLIQTIQENDTNTITTAESGHAIITVNDSVGGGDLDDKNYVIGIDEDALKGFIQENTQDTNTITTVADDGKGYVGVTDAMDADGNHNYTVAFDEGKLINTIKENDTNTVTMVADDGKGYVGVTDAMDADGNHNYTVAFDEGKLINTIKENDTNTVTMVADDGKGYVGVTDAMDADGNHNYTVAFDEGKLINTIKENDTNTVTTVADDGNGYVAVTDAMDADGNHNYTVAFDENKLNQTIEAKDKFVNGGNIGADGKITLNVRNGEDVKLEGQLKDAQLTAIERDKEAGTATLVVKDGYNNEEVRRLTIDDIASKAQNDRDHAEFREHFNELDHRVDNLGSRVDKVGAGAAALAALHPMDFDPDDKLTFAAGYGNYKGKNAAAVGAFYRPDEKVMLSVGGTFGNGENMVNAGISFSLDRTARVSNSRTAMAKEIVDLRANVANLTALVGQLTAGMGGTIEMDRMKLFPDVPENHWAYEYIGRLAAAGIVEGYPDGMFNGNRMMSRYEFAAMLYRALEKGVKLDHKLVREFEPEMGRIHVARISGADGDRGKIERVRVYGGDNRDHYGSKLK
ncbi:YadA-like family protein [Phascolarctobacterium succinatutens]|uniref:YadA-like family protein n=1 Tax=Phascolarctobacterium succinatutens TaxID=626940 RepID=UPI0030798D34